MAEPRPDRAAPRLLTRTDLRAYLAGMPWVEVLDRIARGKLPGPLWRMEPEDKRARWDIRAVDRALDAESDIPASILAEQALMDRAFGLL
jgi:hypothetical protein